MFLRVNKIGNWNKAEGLELTDIDTFKLRSDLSEVHFMVATSKPFPPYTSNKPVNPSLLPPGYRVINVNYN